MIISMISETSMEMNQNKVGMNLYFHNPVWIKNDNFDNLQTSVAWLIFHQLLHLS